MSFNKTIKEENASCAADTVGDLIRYFNIELDEFLVERLDEFPADDKYSIVYDTYSVIELENNTIHVFSGSVDMPDSPNYTLLLDLKHYHLYYIGSGNAGNTIHEYDLSGSLLSEEDFGLKQIDADEFINKHFTEYVCGSINDLLLNFNLNIDLSDKLRQHKISYDLDIYFNEYLIQEHEDIEYYVFQGFFKSIVLDLEPPIIYLDYINQLVYVQSFGMPGLIITVFDSNNNKVDEYTPGLDYFSEVNVAKVLSPIK